MLIQTLLQTDPRARPQLTEIESSSWLMVSRLPPPVPQSVTESLRNENNRYPNTQNSGSGGSGMRPGLTSATNVGIVLVRRIAQ